MENKKTHIAVRIYINLCRLVLAGVFVFSGFVKANDPLGFKYKLTDYIQAFGWEDVIPEQILLVGAIGLSALEFMLGVWLLVGSNRRLASWTAVGMMAVMTPLTLYIALYNPVADCGCFGDAIILSNWQTFYKNIVLTIMAISLVRGKQYIVRFVSHRSEWLVSLYSIVYICLFAIYCLEHLPVFDFRPYKIGNNLKEEMTIPEGKTAPVYETLFNMEKDGKTREFTIDNYPDSTWTFISRRTILKEEGYTPPIHDFDLMEMESGEDITEQILEDEGYTFLLIAHRVENADDADIDLINELYEYCKANGYTFYALTSSEEEQVEQWKDNTGGEYPFCNVDDTTLKTIIRANPGVVMLKGGTVMKKWSACDLPDEYVLTDKLEMLPEGQLHTKDVYEKVATAILWYVIPLLIIFILDYLTNRWIERKYRKL